MDYVNGKILGACNDRKVYTYLTNRSVDVYLQDQHTQLINLRMVQVLSTTTLSSDATIDTYIINLTADHGVIVGNILCIREGTHFYQGRVTVVDTNAITLDIPLDYSYTASGTTVVRANDNMAVNGASTPIIFKVAMTGLSDTVSWDITKLNFSFTDGTAMDESTFGGIAALANGIVVRKKDGDYNNLFIAKTNGELLDYCSEPYYWTKTGGGQYGFKCIKKFSGQENQGVVIRLSKSSNDELQCIVRDDLSDLTDFRIIAIGHVVD